MVTQERRDGLYLRVSDEVRILQMQGSQGLHYLHGVF